MDDQTRREQILQAEESIRLLAAEMAGAKSASAAAEEVRRQLQDALGALHEAREAVSQSATSQAALGESARAELRDAAEQARAQLAGAGERIGACAAAIEEACGRFGAASEDVGRHSDRVRQLVEERLAEIPPSLSAVREEVSQIRPRLEALDGRLPEVTGGLAAVEQRLAAVAESIAAAAQSVEALREDVQKSPAAMAEEVRQAARRQTAYLTWLLVLSSAGLIAGVAAICLIALLLGR